MPSLIFETHPQISGLAREILIFLAKTQASDIHLRVNHTPTFRVDGRIMQSDGTVLRTGEMETLVEGFVELTPNFSEETTWSDFKALLLNNRSANFSCSTKSMHQMNPDIPNLRMRVNVACEQHGLAIVARLLSDTISPLGELGFSFASVETSLLQQLKKKKGLILVTGPVGSGKTTTLAACINYINMHREAHIITLEDPIEIVYPQFTPTLPGTEIYRSLITQREIPRDSPTFRDGLHDALRQDPDVLLVGELRDPETINIALNAAETGCLVFGTLHTNGGFETISRLKSSFSPEKATSVMGQLALNLNCIVSQRLLPKEGGGRVLCFEYVEVSSRVDGMRAAILSGEPIKVVQSMKPDVCVKWNDNLQHLVDSGMVGPILADSLKSEFQDS